MKNIYFRFGLCWLRHSYVRPGSVSEFFSISLLYHFRLLVANIVQL